MGEPFGRILGGDAPGGAEPDLTEYGSERLERGKPAIGHGREELEPAEPEIQSSHDIARIRDSGQERNIETPRRVGDLGGQARADDEFGPGIDTAGEIVRIQNRTGTDQSAVHAGHFTNGIERAGRSQGHFKRGQPARDQRLRDRSR